MNPLDLTGIDPFVDPVIPIPPRTRLYALTPVGLGTPMQESLLSFVVRTAHAHSVNPRRLIATVFSEAAPAFADLAYATFFTKLAGTANGLGQYAELFAGAAERLTGKEGLRQLSMLPWRGLFPHNGQGLLARQPRWCPACFAEQISAGDASMAPLAWSLEAVRVCPKHHQTLQDRCPTCGRHQPFVPRYPDLAVCEHCHCPLAATDGISDMQRPEELTAIERWAIDAVGDMVILPAGIEPNAERFREVLRERISVATGGNRAQFCREMGLQEWGLKGWMTKDERPSPAQFLAVCYGLGNLPSQLFVSSAGHPSKPRLIGGTLKRRAACPRLNDDRKRELQRRLLEHLSAQNPTSIAAAGRELGVPARYLRYWFPDLCTALSQKHQIWIKARSAAHRKKQQQRVFEIVRDVYKAGEYPSRRRINCILRQERMALVQPHLLEAYFGAIKKYASLKLRSGNRLSLEAHCSVRIDIGNLGKSQAVEQP